MFALFEVSTPHIIYALLGGFIVLFGMFSLLLRERLYIGEAIWAFLFGIIMGPYCAGIFDPRAWSNANSDGVTNTTTLEFTRVVLAIGLFAIGVELPKAYMAKHWKSLFFLLVPVMTWGWFVSAGLIYALIPDMNFISALAIAACLTPTDPILASAIVGGKWADKHVPAHIRHLLAAESGCNDGAAFPFLFLPLYLLVNHTTGAAIRDWFLRLWLYQIVLGCVIGCLLGFGFRHLMKFCQRHDLIDRHSYVAQYVSLAFLTIGICTLLGSDDLLAAFCCGTAFAWDGFFNKQTEESVFSSVIDTLFNVAAFIFVGAWMPFNKFQDATVGLTVWRLLVIAILVLLLRRLPIMVILYRWIPDIKTFREAVFSGHFGPMGIGAVFISTLALEFLHHNYHADNPHDTEIAFLQNTIEPIVAFMVLCSITIHGLSIPSFSLGRRVHSVSRTWSRRDTQTSAPPDWTTQTRMVTCGEDIVINRDARDLELGDRPPILEKTESGLTLHTNDTEKLGSSGISEDTRVHRPESPHPQQPEQGVSDYRDQIPPDGTERIAEWIEGSHRIIEKKSGPGSDVEVTVINSDPGLPGSDVPTAKWRGKVHELEHDAEAIGRNISKQLGHLTAKAHGVVPSSRGSSFTKDKQRQEGREGENRPAVVDDSAIADEDEDDEGWASEGESAPGPHASTSESKRLGRSSNRSARGLHHPHTTHRPRRRGSIRRNSNTAADTVEPELKRPTTAGDIGVTFASPHRVSRPATAPSSIRIGTARSSRPGTADSSLRHHRLDSIRALHGSSTRESSPSRSVRFVDEEGRAGSRGIPADSSGRTFVDNPVPEEGSVTPPSILEPSSKCP